MKAFIHKGEVYLRCIPGKSLFRSTMIHEVVNRGDIFAMNVNTQEFTVLSGKSEVEHCEVELAIPSFKPVNEKPVDKPAPSEYTAPSKSQKNALNQLAFDLAAPKFAIGDMVRLSWWTERSRVRIVGMLQGDPHQYMLQGLNIPYNEVDLVKVQ